MTSEEQSSWIMRGLTGFISLMLAITAYLLMHNFEKSEEFDEKMAENQAALAQQVGENSSQIALNATNLAWLRSIVVSGTGSEIRGYAAQDPDDGEGGEDGE